jgi:hypothetical protein
MAFVMAADFLPARWYASNPSSTLMAVWSDERRLFGRFGEGRLREPAIALERPRPIFAK